jgi:hypothetical protein
VNIDVLKYLAGDGDYHVREVVEKTKYAPEATLAVIRKLIKNGGDLTPLSGPETYHFNTFISPLIYNVQCQGAYGEGTCISGVIDDESLLMAYQDDDFLCQICRHDASKH